MKLALQVLHLNVVFVTIFSKKQFMKGRKYSIVESIVEFVILDSLLGASWKI